MTEPELIRCVSEAWLYHKHRNMQVAAMLNTALVNLYCAEESMGKDKCSELCAEHRALFRQGMLDCITEHSNTEQEEYIYD